MEFWNSQMFTFPPPHRVQQLGHIPLAQREKLLGGGPVIPCVNLLWEHQKREIILGAFPANE
jgi:hypothetical protein